MGNGRATDIQRFRNGSATLVQRRCNGTNGVSRRNRSVPVRVRACDRQVMGKKRPGLGAVLQIVARGPERSSLFYYLYDNHDEIARASAGRRIRWQPMAARLNELDLTDGHGKPATAEATRQTWIKVRKEVRKQRSLRATGMLPVAAPRPKKLPADWRPSGYLEPNAPSPTGDEHQGSSPAALPAVPHQWPATPTTTPEMPKGTRRPGSSLDRVRELMNARSGRKPNGEPLF